MAASNNLQVPDSDIKYEDVVSPLSELFTLCMWLEFHVETAYVVGFMPDGPPGWERSIERIFEIRPKYEQAIWPYLRELTIRNEQYGGNIVCLTFEAPTAFELLADLAKNIESTVRRILGWNSDQIHITSSTCAQIKAELVAECQQAFVLLGQPTWAQAWSRLRACLKREQRIVMDMAKAPGSIGTSAGRAEDVSQSPGEEPTAATSLLSIAFVKVKLKSEIPAEFRDGGLPAGDPLTTDVVALPEKYDLKGPYLTRYYRGPVIKWGHKKVDRHTEIAALSDKKSKREDKS